MKEFVIDLFCGAGGTSTGVHLANCNSTVTACVNHDLKAIESHRLNYPMAKHFVEDIRNPEVVFFLKLRVNALRKLYPGCIITIWASLECTNFSKAKGGQPRNGDSRTLANHLFMYLEGLQPDYLMIENVIEFMAWGPLDENGKPLSRRRGSSYLKWIDNVQSYGYGFDWKELNSADFGAYTSRSRYFAQFAKNGLPISWPVKTHAKKPGEKHNLFNHDLQPWKAVKEVLDLEKEGTSIFNRKKPLVDNTLKRIYAGLVKFIANGDDSFIKKYYSGRPEGKVISVNGPAGTITTIDGQCLVYASFLQSYYGNGKSHSLDNPCPTVTTKDRFAKVAPQFIVNSYTSWGQLSSLDAPVPTVTVVPKSNLTSCKFIFNPQFSNAGNSVEKPCPTIIARQDKRPLQLIICDKGQGFAIPVYNDDSEIMVQIKQFMAFYGIVDIKMRMLLVNELLRIQGFPKDYQLVGNQTDQKKFIGNSVEVTTAKAIFEAHHNSLEEYFLTKHIAA